MKVYLNVKDWVMHAVEGLRMLSRGTHERLLNVSGVQFFRLQI